MLTMNERNPTPNLIALGICQVVAKRQIIR